MGTVNLKKFKLFILDIVSFGSAQAIVIDISIILLLLFLLPLQYLLAVSIYSTFVIPYVFNNACPAEGAFKNCGFYSIGQTRALSSFLHGNFRAALEMNKLVLILFIVMIWILVLNLYKSYKYYKKTGRLFTY